LAEAISKIEYLDLDLSNPRWQPPKEPSHWLAVVLVSGGRPGKGEADLESRLKVGECKIQLEVQYAFVVHPIMLP
jgi:hypothetical protein